MIKHIDQYNENYDPLQYVLPNIEGDKGYNWNIEQKPNKISTKIPKNNTKKLNKKKHQLKMQAILFILFTN